RRRAPAPRQDAQPPPRGGRPRRRRRRRVRSRVGAPRRGRPVAARRDHRVDAPAGEVGMAPPQRGGADAARLGRHPVLARRRRPERGARRQERPRRREPDGSRRTAPRQDPRAGEERAGQLPHHLAAGRRRRQLRRGREAPAARRQHAARRGHRGPRADLPSRPVRRGAADDGGRARRRADRLDVPRRAVGLDAEEPDRAAARDDEAADRARAGRRAGDGDRVVAVHAEHLEHGGHGEHEHPPEPYYSSRVSPSVLGMFLFIASEIMLFGSFFTAYFFVRVVNGTPWPTPPFHLPVYMATINTLILVTSSGTMHWATVSIKRGNTWGLRAGLLLTFLMGTSFLATQIF